MRKIGSWLGFASPPSAPSLTPKNSASGFPTRRRFSFVKRERPHRFLALFLRTSSPPSQPRGPKARCQKNANTSPPQSAPSADAEKSTIDGCRPGEKCWRYSRMPAHTHKPPIISIPPRLAPYPAIATAANPAYATKCSSRPGSPVRTICCAGSSDKTAKRMTQHQERTRSTAMTGLARTG